MMTVLITHENSPSVSKLMGMEMKSKKGFTMALSSANTMATMMDVPKFFTDMPGNIHAAMDTPTADRRTCAMVFIVVRMCFYCSLFFCFVIGEVSLFFCRPRLSIILRINFMSASKYWNTLSMGSTCLNFSTYSFSSKASSMRC